MGVENLEAATSDESADEMAEREDYEAKHERRYQEREAARKERSRILGHEIVNTQDRAEARKARYERLAGEEKAEEDTTAKAEGEDETSAQSENSE
jgi:hypothetical protein